MGGGGNGISLFLSPHLSLPLSASLVPSCILLRSLSLRLNLVVALLLVSLLSNFVCVVCICTKLHGSLTISAYIYQ